MRKLIVLCLIALAFAEQGVFEADELNNLLGQSYLGRAILSVSQLEDFDYGKLFVAIDELKASMDERVEEENTLFAKDRQDYLSDQQFFQNQVTQYTNEAAQHQLDLEEFARSKAYTEAALDQKLKESAETKALRETLQREVESNQASWNRQSADYDDAVSVIDQAIQLLKSAKEGSFVEVSELTADMEKKLATHRIFYQPLVKSLAQLAANKFADQDMLGKVLRLLNDLRSSLIENKRQQKVAFETQRDENGRILAQYAGKISQIDNVWVPSMRDEIETLAGQIQTVQGLLTDANNNLEDAKANFQANEDRWVQLQAQHRKLIDEYNNQLQLLSAAVGALQRGGIRRQ